MQLQPSFIPAYVNYADNLSNQGKESKAAKILQLGIQNNPTSADLYHALGLSQVRQKNIETAIKSLAHAVTLNSNNRRYTYVYAIALHSAGKIKPAIKQLKILVQQNPEDIDALYTLVSFNKDIGNTDLALSYAKKLQLLMPNNSNIKNLIKTLKTTDKK